MTGWAKAGLESGEEGKIRNRKFLLMGKRMGMRQEEDAGNKNLLNVTAPLPVSGGRHGGGAEEQLQPQWEDSIPDTSSHHSGVGGVTETFSPC